jgi:hypothetical protein
LKRNPYSNKTINYAETKQCYFEFKIGFDWKIKFLIKFPQIKLNFCEETVVANLFN